MALPLRKEDPSLSTDRVFEILEVWSRQKTAQLWTIVTSLGLLHLYDGLSQPFKEEGPSICPLEGRCSSLLILQGKLPGGGSNEAGPLKEGRVLEGRNGWRQGDHSTDRSTETDKPFVSLVSHFTLFGLSFLVGRIDMI